MHVALLPLLPRKIMFRDRNFRLLKDRNIFDVESIATTDVAKSFFLTLGTKAKSQANFQGDKSLVKEANLFLAVGLQASTRARVITKAEWKVFFEKGFFSWAIIVPETVEVDNDTLAAIAQGPDLERFVDASIAAVDEAVAWGRTYVDRRTFLVGENKIVPGGRAIEFTTNWQEAAGNGLTVATDLRITFDGGEYEPMRG
jgi:hypothetical protein